MSKSKNKKNQQENIPKKMQQQDREEFGYGYDIALNDLKTLGQNESAKSNKTRSANHQVNNDSKNDQR